MCEDKVVELFARLSLSRAVKASEAEHFNTQAHLSAGEAVTTSILCVSGCVLQLLLGTGHENDY